MVEDAVNIGNKMIQNKIYERDKKTISNHYLNFMGIKSKGIFVILAQPGRKWLFSEKYSAIFPLEIELDNNKVLKVNVDKEFKIEDS
ncbi:hypothetical protein [Niallia taxi]|uniref:hypothetical protein n=1 Tax=Niallia taxi TaxID=2499688 RepID=UPI002174F856|nr:hypothetical protein [Niallia taxi]